MPKHAVPLLWFNPKVTFTPPKNKGEEQRGARGEKCKAKFETCIVLHACVGLLEGICHRRALSWEEKRREKEERISQRNLGMSRSHGRGLSAKHRRGGAELLPAIS